LWIAQLSENVHSNEESIIIESQHNANKTFKKFEKSYMTKCLHLVQWVPAHLPCLL